MSVGGNLYGIVQVKTKNGHMNQINEWVEDWQDCIKLCGWLDLSTGDSERTTFGTKIQESTHIFLCDYQVLAGKITVGDQEETVLVTSENARMVINGFVYDILLIDNPMNMNEHYEIYLKFIGGQDG